MRFSFALVFIAASLMAGPASAGPILDRIRADGVVRCGAVERPGLIEVEDSGKAAGLELDLCRAIASVALGPNGRLEFRNYDCEKAFGEVRAGKDDVSFLTGREMIDNGLTGKMIAGPATPLGGEGGDERRLRLVHTPQKLLYFGSVAGSVLKFAGTASLTVGETGVTPIAAPPPPPPSRCAASSVPGGRSGRRAPRWRRSRDRAPRRP